MSEPVSINFCEDCNEFGTIQMSLDGKLSVLPCDCLEPVCLFGDVYL